ncbi:inositol-tetrakisphosphate 1-kinase-like [Panonychus citri]|uniref:inositol-tetrakisphosphate 1-kinase-like n=1 Tax=Panonychus citri TaxID=50023 RepID=UPI0023081FF7|nr:inositol-tetrakisphosphate 1-kinase-like [Panonychus citri]XP_053202962.1 inositol-tetrakisphosphate 1-kinase-like [Panonychus citri]
MAKVGYWWSEKKTQRFNQQELELKLSAIGFNLVRLDLDEDLTVQGPFVAIIHKLSDILIKADSGDEKASQIINAFQNYVKLNPQVVIIDPLPNLWTLLNRYEQYRIIKDCPLASKEGFFTPTFVELTSKDSEINRQKLIANGVKFPFVCKPLEAHGGSFAHQMSLIFNEKGLKDINPPCVAQTFINHNAKLFKIFVIHEKYFVVDRPSLKNFKAGDFPTLHFDSPDVSKANSSSRLTELDEDDEGGPTPIVNDEIVSKLVNILRTILGLNLFGIDLIIENETDRYLIIDMNIFPGYDGVTNHIDLIAEMVSSMVRSKKQASPEKSDNLIESDSGIDTSDSCDENKKGTRLNLQRKKSSLK